MDKLRLWRLRRSTRRCTYEQFDRVFGRPRQHLGCRSAAFTYNDPFIRLAGALAWWIPGSRDVINGLGVEPPEEDNDDEILDALRLVLEKDSLIDATQVNANCENAVITLTGLVTSNAQKELVEFDAWALFGVDNVVNQVEVIRG